MTDQPPAAAPTPAPTPARRNNKLVLLIVGVSVLAVLCVCVGALTLLPSRDTNPATGAASPAPASPTPAAAAPSVDPREQLRKAVTDKLGKPNRDGVPMPLVAVEHNTGAITVEWALNDNLSRNLIKAGARGDVIDIIRIVKTQATWPYTELLLKATFSLVDKFGNTSESIVIRLSYTPDTIAKINPDGVQPERIYDLATGTVHPDFK